MKKIHLICLASLAALSSSALYAQNTGHFYGGLSAGQSESKFDNDRISNSLVGAGVTGISMTKDQNDPAYKVFVGYQFNPYFGVEGGYFNLGKFGFETQMTPLGTLNGQFKVDGINFDLIGSIPVNDQLSILARMGVIDGRSRDLFTSSGAVVLTNSNPEINKRDYKAGLGFAYKFSQSMTLRGEIERYKINDAVGGKSNINLATLSLVFPFGKTAEKPTKVVERIVYQDIPKPVKQEPVVIKEPPVVVYVTTPAPPPAPTPAPMPITTPERLKVSFNADVLFGFDLSNISPAGKRALDKFVEEIRNVQFDEINIQGHTDRIGTQAYNEKLSLQRANAVKSYLVLRNAAPANKMTTVGKGSTEPLTEVGSCKGVPTSSAVIACLESDRRVDLDVTGTRSTQK
jgi:OOP family OmpA-OmpF porin